ncbi:MAG: alpha/beta hydrolase [Spirochaetales bacterium]|nr:alpha/beta hydrolase [Spirochaetales bacterium]
MHGELIELSTGATLHYEEKGEGEPVVVVHGLLGTARDELGEVIDWLAESYRVFGLTLRGYGASLPKPRRFPPDFYYTDADDVVAFMDALDLDRVHYLGFSDGGEIGLILGGKHPDRFRSVSVWGAIGFLGPAVREEVRKYYPATWVTDEVKARHGIDDPNPMIKEWVEAIVSMVDAGGDISLHLADRIRAPLLLMLGETDYLNPPEYARILVERAGQGRLEMFPCGHEIHDQQPEAFRRVVGDFLASVSGS